MSESTGITTDFGRQYDFRKSIEDRATEFATQDIESILFEIYEKNSDEEWERKTVLLKSRHAIHENQNRITHEKAAQYRGIGKTALLSGEVFFEAFKAFTGNNALSPLCVAAALACRYTNSAQDELRNNRNNLFDHSTERFRISGQDLGSDIQKLDSDCSKSLDTQIRLMENSRNLARSILS